MMTSLVSTCAESKKYECYVFNRGVIIIMFWSFLFKSTNCFLLNANLFFFLKVSK